MYVGRYVCNYVCLQMYASMYVLHVCMYVNVYKFICANACMHVCMYVCISCIPLGPASEQEDVVPAENILWMSVSLAAEFRISIFDSSWPLDRRILFVCQGVSNWSAFALEPPIGSGREGTLQQFVGLSR